MHRAFRIARIRGVEVRLDPSLVLLALLLGWLLTVRFGDAYGTVVALAMALVTTLLFFASILTHELAHAFEALHRDIEVAGVTLLLFGGVTEMHGESQHPRDEFVIAAVGPYASLVCAAVFGLVAAGADAFLSAPVGPATLEVALLLAFLNVLLAVFNLVPGAPLDGGRVLRAALWWLTRDRGRAVRVSARAGQGFGAVIVAFGLVEFTRGLEMAAIGGLWWVVIGVFLFGAARTELRRADLLAVYAGRTVVDVLGPGPQVVGAGHGLDLLDPDATGDDHVLVTAADDPDRVAGYLDVDELRQLHPTDRAARTAADLARPVAHLQAVSTDLSLEGLVQHFVRGDHGRVRVEHDGRVVAVLSERRTAQALHGLGAGRRRRTSAPSPPEVAR